MMNGRGVIPRGWMALVAAMLATTVAWAASSTAQAVEVLQPLTAAAGADGECSANLSPLEITNANGVEVRYRVEYVDPPSIPDRTGTAAPDSITTVQISNLGLSVGGERRALVDVFWFDGASWLPVDGNSISVPDPDCPLGAYQQILSSGCVDGEFEVEVIHYTAFADMTVEIEGGETVVLEPGQAQTATADDIDGDGFVSTLQTGPVPGERPTVDTPFEDCSQPGTVVTCGGLVATIVGTDDGETIHGTSGDDVIAALGGNDTVYGHGGDDVICAGSGRDRAFGNGGDDVLNGGAANDQLFGGAGRDVLRGQVGNDTLRGGSGNDDLFGGVGNDLLIGQAGGRDECFGEGGNDRAKTCEVLVGLA